MQVHDICCRFHQLARSACQQHAGKAHLLGTVQQKAQIIAAKDDRSGIRILPPQPRFSGVSCHKGTHLSILCPAHGKFQRQRLPDSLFAHRAHNAGCPQNGDTAFDAQPSVKRFLCNAFSVRHGNRHHRTFCADHRAHSLFDHLSRHRIDRRLTRRKFQPFSGHNAHAVSGTELHSAVLRQNLHSGIYQTAVGLIRVVAAVFSHAAGVRRTGLYRQTQFFSGRHYQFHPLRAAACGLPQHRCQACAGGTGTRGISFPQPFHSGFPHCSRMA